MARVPMQVDGPRPVYVGRQALKAEKKIKPKTWNTLRSNSTG